MFEKNYFVVAEKSVNSEPVIFTRSSMNMKLIEVDQLLNGKEEDKIYNFSLLTSMNKFECQLIVKEKLSNCEVFCYDDFNDALAQYFRLFESANNYDVSLEIPLSKIRSVLVYNNTKYVKVIYKKTNEIMFVHYAYRIRNTHNGKVKYEKHYFSSQDGKIIDTEENFILA